MTDTTLRPTTVPGRLGLALLRTTRPVWRWLRLDVGKVDTLLALYLVLDERRGKRHEDGPAPSTPVSGGLVLTTILYLVCGLAFGALLFLEDKTVAIGFQQLAILGFAVLVLVGDYSAVLLDDTDLALIEPLAIDDRSLAAARILHIIAYLSITIGALALPGLVLGLIATKALLFVPAYLFCCVTTALLAVLIAFGGLIVVARRLDVERFSDALLWIQVGITIVTIVAFQLAPELLRAIEPTAFRAELRWLLWAVPTFWSSSLVAFVTSTPLGDDAWRAVAGLVLPAGCLLLLARIFSTGFIEALANQAQATKSRRADAVRIAPNAPNDRARMERAGHDFLRALTAGERQYRLRTYPAAAIAIVLPIIFATRESMTFGRPGMLVIGLYMVGLYSPLFAMLARHSENFEARWLFEVSPITDRKPFVDGARRALVRRRLLPLLLFASVVMLAIGGTAVIWQLLFALNLTLIAAITALRLTLTDIPFTRKLGKKIEGVGVATLAGAFCMTLLGFAQYGLSTALGDAFALVAVALVPLTALIVWAPWRQTARS